MKNSIKVKIVLYAIAMLIATATLTYNLLMEPIIVGNIQIYANQSIIYLGVCVASMFALGGILVKD